MARDHAGDVKAIAMDEPTIPPHLTRAGEALIGCGGAIEHGSEDDGDRRSSIHLASLDGMSAQILSPSATQRISERRTLLGRLPAPTHRRQAQDLVEGKAERRRYLEIEDS